MASGAAYAVDTTVVVTPAALGGWAIQTDGVPAEVPYAFTTAQAATGTGSLQFRVDGPTGADKFFLLAPYDGATAGLESFSYQYMVTTDSTGDTQNLYVNVYVDSSANGIGTFQSFYDCRYDLVPPSGQASGTWHTASFTGSTTFTNVAKPLASCPDTLGALPAGSEVMVIVLNGGQSTTSDNGLRGGFDDVVIDTTGGTTTYDFEPATACATSTSGTMITLLADCTVTETFQVPDGFTLDGDGYTMTASASGFLKGAVVQNAPGATTMNVVDLTVDANGAGGSCDSWLDRLTGIRFLSAGGSVSGSTVQNILQAPGLRGCQEGTGIEIRNTDVDGNPLAGTRHAVSVSQTTVSAYQKTGIVATGNVAASITGSTFTGLGPVDYIAGNGIQVSYGATALIESNTISANFYTPPPWVSCGLIFVDASGVKQRKNTFVGNEVNVCNVGRGGGKYNPAA